MTWYEAIIIAIVEGLTEFLPISSTGHMIITEHLLGVQTNEFVKAFMVIIQFGAILSVIVLYYKKFVQIKPIKVFDLPKGEALGLWDRIKHIALRLTDKFDFYWKLFIAFIPAAVLGFIFSDAIDELLESVQVVAIMLILGGVLMLFVDKIFAKTSENQDITNRKALIIGFCQCVAMIPGVSRSMATIVGGMSQRLTRKSAAEFSFFLAVPTMFAASAWKLYQLISNPVERQILIDNVDILIVGNIIAFVVAVLAIKFFINFLTKHGFKAFGYYRIILGVLLLAMLWMNLY
ncbi:MAG: undecaprenyl-diphosphate phosphatase [Porphyromonadaceae bacterium]|nr:undecaprenyl-diphosphate phosphatase [Porphyromonadaceae bacterium]